MRGASVQKNNLVSGTTSKQTLSGLRLKHSPVRYVEAGKERKLKLKSGPQDRPVSRAFNVGTEGGASGQRSGGQGLLHLIHQWDPARPKSETALTH